MQTIIGQSVAAAQELLQQNNIVGIPTETVYGLAANAESAEAIAKIFEAKQRPRFNPLIMHVATIAAIENYATLNNSASILAKAFMPGPFTLLLPKKETVLDIITAGSNKVAIRVPQHALLQELLQQLPFTLVAPSANSFGYVSPTTAAHVYNNLQGKIPYILDGGACTVGVESTIVEATDDTIIIYRNGGVTPTEIQTLLPNHKIIVATNSETVATPGQLKSHYATHTPLRVSHNIAQEIANNTNKKIAILSFATTYSNLPLSQQYVLSPNGSLPEAATKLFAAMQFIDSLDYDIILAEVFPNEGIGLAINDRLQRAQAINKD
jgi:L-threonylcarbamoyladenylate synthase